MKKTKKRLCIIISIYVIIGIIVALIATSFTIDSYSKTSIQRYKEICYEIYNKGILQVQEKLSYDNININSSSHEDQNILYNKGLRYVTYLDLMDFELYNTLKPPFKHKEIPYEKIKFSEKQFLIYYGIDNPLYLKITVDRDYIDDIKYYEYEESWDIKILLKKVINYFIKYILLVIVVKIIMENSNDDEDEMYNYDDESSKNDEISEEKNVSNEEK